MKISAQRTDASILEELGERLASARLGKNLTQAALADQAGVSKRTVERLESGAVATQLSGFLRICRVLGLVEHFERLIPEACGQSHGATEATGRKTPARLRQKSGIRQAGRNGHGVTGHDRGGATLGTEDLSGFPR
jgi:transcriptional regulator with XRE-family HTH domain